MRHNCTLGWSLGESQADLFVQWEDAVGRERSTGSNYSETDDVNVILACVICNGYKIVEKCIW